jgi:hypothetical protein
LAGLILRIADLGFFLKIEEGMIEGRVDELIFVFW